MCFTLFSIEIFSKCPPEENEINLALLFLEFFNMDVISSVFPETLVVTTKVLESTVLGEDIPLQH